jgi:hypothetical protein
MNADLCPKDRRGRHQPRSLAGFGDPKGEVVQVFCDKCNKILYDKNQESDETPFPGLNKDTK